MGMWGSGVYDGDVQMDMLDEVFENLVKVGRKYLKVEYDNTDALIACLDTIFSLQDRSGGFFIDDIKGIEKFLKKAKTSIDEVYYTKDDEGKTGFDDWENSANRKRVVKKIYRRLLRELEVFEVEEK